MSKLMNATVNIYSKRTFINDWPHKQICTIHTSTIRGPEKCMYIQVYYEGLEEEMKKKMKIVPFI